MSSNYIWKKILHASQQKFIRRTTCGLRIQNQVSNIPVCIYDRRFFLLLHYCIIAFSIPLAENLMSKWANKQKKRV